MLNLCVDFGYKNDVAYNVKKSVSISPSKLFEVASRAEMFIEEGIIDWVEICCYLGVNICSGEYFCTDYEERKRKFCATAIIVLFLINLHSLKNVNCTF